MAKEGLNKWNENAGENQIYMEPGTGPQRNIGPRMARVERPDLKKSIAEDYLVGSEPDEIAKGRNKAKADSDSMGPKYKSGGKVSSASKRADGCATKGKTRGRMV